MKLFYFFTLVLFYLLCGEAWAVVGHESSTESHTGTTGSTSQASFDITVPFTSSTRGLLVFTYNANSNANDATSVKINPAGANTDVPAVTGGLASDTVGEPGSCKAWFLGSGLPTASGTVRVNRTNNANIMYAVAITVTGSTASTFVAGTPTLQQNDAAMTEAAVDSGTAVAMRYACGYTGAVGPPTAGANSTLLQSIAFGALSAGAARETNTGSGSRSAGLVAGSDDRAEVVLALAEVLACTGTTWTSTGNKAISGPIGAADSVTTALPNTSSGSFIVVATALYDSDATPSTITVSDTVNGAYTQSFYLVPGADRGLGLHFFQNNAGGNLSITSNAVGATADYRQAIHEFCGGHATPASGTPSTLQTTTSPASTGTMTPADNDVLLIAALNDCCGTTVTENAGGQGFTLSNEAETVVALSLVYKIISGAPGTVSETWTLASPVYHLAGIAAFRASSSTPVGGAATNPGILRRRIQ